jgi:hypothetical protein
VIKQADSSLWKTLLQLWPNLDIIDYWSIGSDENVHVWNDYWINPEMRILDLNITILKV